MSGVERVRAPCSRRAPRSPRCGRSPRRASTSRDQRLLHARVVAVARPARGSARPDELRLLLVERREQLAAASRGPDCARRSRRRPSRSRSFGLVERLAHRVVRARVVEAGEQDERAEADVAVGVLGDGLRAAPAPPARAGARRTVPRRVRPRVVVERRRACRSPPGVAAAATACGAAGSCARAARRRAAGRRRASDQPATTSATSAALGDATACSVRRPASSCRASARAAGSCVSSRGNATG